MAGGLQILKERKFLNFFFFFFLDQVQIRFVAFTAQPFIPVNGQAGLDQTANKLYVRNGRGRGTA